MTYTHFLPVSRGKKSIEPLITVCKNRKTIYFNKRTTELFIQDNRFVTFLTHKDDFQKFALRPSNKQNGNNYKVCRSGKKRISCSVCCPSFIRKIEDNIGKSFILRRGRGGNRNLLEAKQYVGEEK